MLRWLKRAAYALAVLLLLVAGGAVAVRLFLSSAQVKVLAETQGREFLGRKVSLESLSIGLFSVEAAGVTVAGAPGEATPLLKVDEVQVLLNPAALLYKRVSLLKVTLNGVVASAARDASGRLSFQDVLDRLAAPATSRAPRPGGSALAALSPAPAEAAEEKGASSGFEVVIRAAEARDVKLTFASAAAGGMPAFRAACTFSSLRSGTLREGAPLDLTAEGSCTEPGLVRFSAGAYADLEHALYSGWVDMQPFEAASFYRLAPPLESLRALRGSLGGKLSVTASAAGDVRWEADLRAKDLGAEVRPDPLEDWRPVQLQSVSLKSKGKFDWKAFSAEVASLEVELPFAKGRLAEPAKWNLAGQDRVHARAELADAAAAARWASETLGFPAPEFTRAGKLSLDFIATRERARGQNFALRAAAEFDPIDLLPLAAWAPPAEGFQPRKAVLGGKLEVSWSGTNTIRWKMDLAASDLAFGFRGKPSAPWRPVEVAGVKVRSEGWVDVPKEEAELAQLEIELPFAKGRLLEKGGWNLAGRDHLKLSLQVADTGGVLRLVRDVTGVRLRDPGKGGGAELTLDLARTRGKEERLSASAKGKLDPVDLSIVGRLVALPPALKGLGGAAGGAFDVSFATGQPLRWKTDFSGKALVAEVKPDPEGPWRRVRLTSLGLRSEGWFDPKAQAAEVARLEVELPFGAIKLGKLARWNVGRKDEIALSLDIDDLSAAEVWVGSVVELPIKLGAKGETLLARLSASRDRARAKAFDWGAEAKFDPLEIGPLVRLGLESSPTLGGAGGEVSGRLGVSYAASGAVRWDADLKGEDLWVSARPAGKARAEKTSIGKVTLRSKGGYDIRRGSAEVASLRLETPFGKVRVPRPSVWNLRGRDEVHLAWDVTNLASALTAAGAVAGGPLAEVSLAGTSRGEVVLSRRRGRRPVISLGGKAEVNARKVRLRDYPNLEVEAAGMADFNGKDARLDLARVIVRDLARPKDPPAVRLESLTGTFGEAELLGGKVVSGGMAARLLAVNVYMDPENNSTLDSLAAQRKAAKARAASPSRPGGAPPAAKPAPKSSASGKKNGPASKPLPVERRNEDLPEIRVRRLEIRKLDFRFHHDVEKGKPPVVVDRRDFRLMVDNIDTRMAAGRMDTHVVLRAPEQPPALYADVWTNLGVAPIPARGILNLHKYDLKPLSPYALSARQTEIREGQLDIGAEFTVKRAFLSAKARGKVHNLKLRVAGRKNFLNKAQEIAQTVALELLRKKKGEIPISVRVKGRLDDSTTTIYKMAVDSVLGDVFSKVLGLGDKTKELGGNVGDILKGVIQDIVPGLQTPQAQTPPQAQQEPQAAPQQPEATPPPEPPKKRSLKDLERELRKGLKGLFGR